MSDWPSAFARRSARRDQGRHAGAALPPLEVIGLHPDARRTPAKQRPPWSPARYIAAIIAVLVAATAAAGVTRSFAAGIAAVGTAAAGWTFRNHGTFRDHGAFGEHGPIGQHVRLFHRNGFRHGIGRHTGPMETARWDRRGNGFLIIGRLRACGAEATSSGPPRRRRGGKVLGIVGRLRFQHDLVQRQRPRPRRRFGGHVASGGKLRPRGNFSRRLLFDRRHRLVPHGKRGTGGRGIPRLPATAQNAPARHARHVAAGQSLDRTLQADLSAHAGLQFDAPCRRHVASHHSPLIQDDVGSRSVGVSRIAEQSSVER